jgi:hypothetical protein
MVPVLRRSLAVLLPSLVFACTLATASESPMGVEAPAAPAVGAPTPPLDSTGLAFLLSGLPSRQGNLVDHLQARAVAPARSEGFQEPGGTELIAFERAFQQLLLHPSPVALEDLRLLGYAVTHFQQTGGGSWLLLEEQPPRRGGGTFAINLAPARDLWLETPHSDSDEGTLRQGATQAVALGARALLVNGAHRCASSASTPCDGVTRTCGGSLRISDSAHFARTFFTAAHRALRAATPDGIAVSLHGMDSPGPEAAIVSDGTRQPLPDSLSVRLRDALNRRLSAGRAFSCNDPADGGKFRPLCGTTNVQGRLDNGSPDACSTEASATARTSPRTRFLHLEQGAPLRQPGAGASDVVLEALGESVPCTLPGSGMGCASVSPAGP